MALGQNCSFNGRRGSLNTTNVDAMDEELGAIQCTRAMRRKRILVANPFKTPVKKQYGARLNSERSLLEGLPQDILVSVLYCVDHDDLKQLFHVSKSIREATLIAKQCHFAFSTPSSKIAALRPFSDLEDTNKFDSQEAPNAPIQQRSCRSRIGRKKLADIAVALFHSPDEM